MSLDLSDKTGVAYTEFTTPLTTNLSAITSANFVNGTIPEDAGKFVVFVAPATDLTITPSTTFVTLQSGMTMVVVKANTNAKRLLFTDPETSAALNYVGKQFESYTLVYDGTQWVFHF
jgi:hypothetical protein